MSRKPPKHIVLTGPPGIGKTTIIKKVSEMLKQHQLNVIGFYTEELRNDISKRIGFDIVTLDGKRGRLSRTMDVLKPGDSKQFRVGQYYVFPESFEKLVLPLFNDTKYGVLILDEIGKMELLSKIFQTKVKESFERTDISILATVPLLQGARIPLIEVLIADKQNHLITVNVNNRNNLDKEIVGYFSQ